MKPGFRHRLTPEQREEIVRRNRAGETAQALAAEFGCDPSNVFALRNAKKRVRAEMREEAQRNDKVARLELALDPRRWTPSLSEAWCRAIPDVYKAFHDLKEAALICDPNEPWIPPTEQA